MDPGDTGTTLGGSCPKKLGEAAGNHLGAARTELVFGNGSGSSRARSGLGEVAIRSDLVWERPRCFRDVQAKTLMEQGAREVPKDASAKILGLGFLHLHLRQIAMSRRHGGGKRPALPGLRDLRCYSRSSGSFGLRVAVAEPSALS